MKKTILTFILLHTISLLVSQTHQRTVNSPEARKREKIVSTEPVINQDHWNLLVPAAQKAYTKDQAARISSVKIKQINYLYSSSYTIVNSGNCKVSNDEINFSEILSKRLETSAVKVPLTSKEGCKYEVELYSLDQVQKEFNKIEKENQ